MKRKTAWAISAAVLVVLAAIFWPIAVGFISVAMTEALFVDLERALANDSAREERRERGAVDLTETVRRHIPIGATVESARDLMERVGFEVRDVPPNQVPTGVDQMFSGVLVSPIWRTFFSYHSFNITIKAKNGIVESIVAWAAFTAI